MKFAIFVGALLLASQAHAIGSVTAHVVQVRVDASGTGMVFFDQPVVGSPSACGQDSAYKSAFAFGATPAGKNILAFALFAKATNATVTVYGSGACTVYGDYVEDWSYGQLQ